MKKNTEISAPSGMAPDWNQLTERTEQYAREEPAKAVGLAFLAGLVLTILPIGGLISGVMHFALTLVRPALLVLGAMKLYEKLQERGDTFKSHSAPPTL